MSQLEIPYAMYLLGKAHENGLWGVSKNKDEAIRLYRESANLGCTAAISALKEEPLVVTEQ